MVGGDPGTLSQADYLGKGSLKLEIHDWGRCGVGGCGGDDCGIRRLSSRLFECKYDIESILGEGGEGRIRAHACPCDRAYKAMAESHSLVEMRFVGI